MFSNYQHSTLPCVILVTLLPQVLLIQFSSALTQITCIGITSKWNKIILSWTCAFELNNFREITKSIRRQLFHVYYIEDTKNDQNFCLKIIFLSLSI